MKLPFARAAPACQRAERASTKRLNPYTKASPSMSRASARSDVEWASRQAQPRVEHARGDRNAQEVVDKGKEKVLADVAYRAFAQDAGLGDAPQIAFDEHYARAAHRDVGAGAHGDADICLRERRCIVHSV